MRVKTLLLLVLISACFTLANTTDAEEKSNITYTYPTKDTLVIAGEGIIPGPDLEYYDEEAITDIKKIVVKEGVTGLGDNCFARNYPKVVSIELPSTIQSIGKRAFMECYRLKQISLPSGISEIPEECFKDCCDLKEITIPNTVMTIGKDAFLECESLIELVIPEKLSVWDNPIEKCPRLKKVVNQSSMELELDHCKGNKNWYVNKKKAKKVAAGATALSKGKKFKISYDLLGGKKSGKLPSSYTYGNPIKLPTNAKKKKICNLKRNKRYYVQVAYVEPEDDEWGTAWVGKRSVVIKK
nr:leucine-rich repeat domain-containing protein [Eubacterium sp.]